jgi:hypothetical protein
MCAGNNPTQNVIMTRGYEAACIVPLLSSLCLLHTEPQITNIHWEIVMLIWRLPDVTNHSHISSCLEAILFLFAHAVA